MCLRPRRLMDAPKDGAPFIFVEAAWLVYTASSNSITTSVKYNKPERKKTANIKQRFPALFCLQNVNNEAEVFGAFISIWSLKKLAFITTLTVHKNRNTISSMVGHTAAVESVTHHRCYCSPAQCGTTWKTETSHHLFCVWTRNTEVVKQKKKKKCTELNTKNGWEQKSERLQTSSMTKALHASLIRSQIAASSRALREPGARRSKLLH